jgi:hypothetical protein
MPRRPFVALIVALAAVGVASPLAAQGDLNCTLEDFSSQREAQLVLQADPSDPNNLDGNGDGVACEDLFGGIGVARPGSEVMVSAEDPTGSVTDLPTTGSGPAATAGARWYMATVAAACSLVALLAVSVLTRHRCAANLARS